MGSSHLPYPAQTRVGRSKTWPVALLALIGVLATAAHFHAPVLSLAVSGDPSGVISALGSLGSSNDAGDLQRLAEQVKCPVQPKALHPKLTWDLTETERNASIVKFQQAVQIPTESFDDNGEPNEDRRWAPFPKFQKWLKQTFPLAHEKAEVEYVNTLGILATFKGSDPSLKPLLLMSHYDVVPAPSSTFDRWTHAPFSGFNDGEFIWGRGASDDKTLLVAQWESITHLLENGFEPRRTLILSHGFDEEEVFARRGQGHIAPLLEERYGKDGLLMVIDEGTGWTDDFFGAPFALPAMGEKGYLDIKITVGTAGSHSSVPPAHTGIGIMAKVIDKLESHPFPIKFTPSSPLLTSLFCANDHAKLPHKWSQLLAKGTKGYNKLAQAFSDISPAYNAGVRTTIAVDVINGGVKVNALPEVVTALVNFRINFDESIASTQEHVSHLLHEIAKDFDMNFSSFESNNATLGGRYLKVETLGLPLEPAPRTPSSGDVWDLFAGTVKAAFPGPDGQERTVTPFASTGNTDCKLYYNLTKNVYRFMGSRTTSLGNAHTVDEKASIEAHFDIIAWIHAIIQNADAFSGEE